MGYDSMLGNYTICRVYVLTTEFPVAPSNHYTDSGTHIPHPYKKNEHDYDEVDRKYADCGFCKME